MKSLVLAITLCLITLAIPNTSMARSIVHHSKTEDTKLDSILIRLNSIYANDNDSIVDRLSAQVYIQGISKPLERKKTARYLSNILPFESHEGRTTAVEALCQLNYQNPCPLQFTPLSFKSNNKSGRRILQESFQILLPMYSFRRMKDKGSDKSFVLPFSDDGLERYEFSPIDTISHQGESYQVINFEPIHEHHTLGMGYMVLDMSCELKALSFSGRIDFGKVDYFVTFKKDDRYSIAIPAHNRASISYNYAGNTGVNEFDCYITFDEIVRKPKRSHSMREKLNVTDIYDRDYAEIDLEQIRPVPLSPEAEAILSTSTISARQKRNLLQKLPEKLVGSNHINAFGNDVRISGPLDPASFAYDKRDGFTVRERMRFSRVFDNGKSFLFKPDFGYSFKLKEFRYKVSFDWIYNPMKRGGFSISASNRTSEFSSKFKNDVDKVLMDTSQLTFKDLGIDFYRRHEAKIEHSYELANGLMFFQGISYNYRDPVKHGSRAMSQERIDALVNDHYADFSPYLRLTWTPHQYYHYQKNQKLYMSSYCPTFSVEVARGLKHVFGSTSDYGRLEFDMHHSINLGDMRTVAYHVGMGEFLRQKGEYFINYTYFSRSMFPSTWEDHIGGKFTLLDDYWYNSSPTYVQAHFMYETPFLLLHHIHPISKYVIKERLYLSNLWAEGKNSYTEVGYGIGNNYFNVGLFSSFIGFKVNEVGIKASIEIDSHW